MPDIKLNARTGGFTLTIDNHSIDLPATSVGMRKLYTILTHHDLALRSGRKVTLGMAAKPTQHDVNKLVDDYYIRKQLEAQKELDELGLNTIDLEGII